MEIRDGNEFIKKVNLKKFQSLKSGRRGIFEKIPEIYSRVGRLNLTYQYLILGNRNAKFFFQDKSFAKSSLFLFCQNISVYLDCCGSLPELDSECFLTTTMLDNMARPQPPYDLLSNLTGKYLKAR